MRLSLISSRKVCSDFFGGGKSVWKDGKLQLNKATTAARLYSSTVGEDVPLGIPDLGIAKAYDAADVEDKILQKWESWKKSSKNRREGLPLFRMTLPPPNVTGKLHLGHALTVAVEDSIARRLIMQGYNVQWIPGFDHAGIATQSVVARKMEVSKNEKSKVNIESEIRKFAQQNLVKIKEQLQSTGALLDWDHAYYTLDENHSAVVQEAFVQLFESGLINREDGIVNWCCSLQSSVADIEVDHVDFNGLTTIKVPGCELPVEFGVLYYCGYQLENSDEVLAVATSRPETMFGDVALAINPTDSRYARFIGRKAINPVNNKLIPVIGDSRVKTDFGSGVVKITPAHDKLDFAIGTTHNLEKISIFTSDGCLSEAIAPDFKGVDRFSARKLVLDQLDKSKQLFGRKGYSGSFGLCSRTGDVIEPRLLPHWFLQTQHLTDKFLDSLNQEKFRIHPSNHRISLTSRLQSCQNWCLSRQIKWGHPIPAYRHKDFPDTWVAATDINIAKQRLENRLGLAITSNSDILQDQDVLDTWFSSALIPLSTGGWPDTNNVQKIGLMETGHDILLFWVWRMAIVTIALTDKLPFDDVLLHGIVNDHYGRKMSKSRGNVIDPMHVIKGIAGNDLINEANQALACGELQQSEFELRVATLKDMYPVGFRMNGNDALRFSLLSQDLSGEEIKLNLTYLENCRHFCNKIWQAFRFYALHAKYVECKRLDGEIIKPDIQEITNIADHWLLACLHEFTQKTATSLDQYRFHLHSIAVRNFFQTQLCDVYIELIKEDLRSGKNVDQHLLVMRYALGTGLKLTHPLLPFVTEELWSHLSQAKDSFILDQPFPQPEDTGCFQNNQVDVTIQKVTQIAREIRSIKTRAGVKGKRGTNVFVDIPSSKSSNQDVFLVKDLIENLSNSTIQFGLPNASEKSQYLVVIFPFHDESCKVSLLKTKKTAADMEMERDKILRMQDKICKLKEQFGSKKFQKNASPAVKEKMRKKLEALEMQLHTFSQPSNTTDENTQNP